MELIRKYEDIILSILSVLMTVSFYGYIVYDKSFPLPEGWYTYYAQCIHNGSLPYRDFEFLFAPLYIYLISFFTSIFGYNLIYLRIFGIIIFSIIGIGLFLCFRVVFGNFIATISAITATLYLQSEPPQIFYDYVRVMDIFSVYATLFLVISVKKILDGESPKLFLAICGLMCSGFILTKQNMGIIFGLFVVFFLILISLYNKMTLRKAIQIQSYFIIFLLIPILITSLFLYINGMLDAFLSNTGSEAINAKGGMLAILFNWIIALAPQIVLLKNKILFVVGGGIIFYVLSKTRFIIIKNEHLISIYHYKKPFDATYISQRLSYFWFAPIITLGILVFISSEEIGLKFNKIHGHISPYLIFFSVFFLACFLFYQIYRKSFSHDAETKFDILNLTIALSYGAIAYGCGTSGGLVEGQSAIGLAFIIAFVTFYTRFKYGKLFRIGIMLICILISLQSIDKKLVMPYNWWGTATPNYWKLTQRLDIPILRGLYVSRNEKFILDDVYTKIRYYSKANDSIYCFPQIPIFYTITSRRDPEVWNKVQWFDVSSDQRMYEDIERIKNRLPKMILMCDVDANVYNAHEKLFRGGTESGTRRMFDFLNKLTLEKYKRVGIYIMDNNYLELYVLKE